MKIVAGWLVSSLLVLPAFAVAQGQPADGGHGCARAHDAVRAEGPVALGFGDADVATGRRACPRTEAGLAVRAGAAVDIPNFYGLIGVSALLSGSWALRPDVELFATAEVLRYQYGINASLYGNSLALGQLTAGATHTFFEGGPLALGASARVMLPTSTATLNVRTVGVELGAPASFRLSPSFEAHGYAGFDLTAGLGAGPLLPRFGLLLNAGVEYAPLSWLALVLDANAHLGNRALVDYVAPSFAVRVGLWRGLAAELGLALQVIGPRSLSFSPGMRLEGVGGLRFTWRL